MGGRGLATVAVIVGVAVAAVPGAASEGAAPKCFGEAATLTDADADQFGDIVGTKKDDVIATDLHGTIYGGGGGDLICAPRADEVEGANGNDSIRGGDRSDGLYGGGGHDRVISGRGNDYVEGGPGNDEIAAGPGNDHLIGDPGDDELLGDVGVDFVEGRGGDDSLDGGSERDDCRGGGGSDTAVDCEQETGVP